MCIVGQVGPVSNKVKTRRERALQRARERRNQSAPTAFHLLHTMEVVSALAWALHDAPVTTHDEIVSRSATIMASIESVHEMEAETSFIVLEMITAALTIDAMRASQFPGDHVPDESLNDCLIQISADLRRMDSR